MEVGGIDSEMLTPRGLDEGGDDTTDLSGEQGPDVQNFYKKSKLVWTTIMRFVNNLTKEEIAQAEFCGCVNSIIEAYEAKVEEVKILQNQVDLLKNMHRKEKIKVQQLKATIYELRRELASSVCEQCGEKNITEIAEQLDVLSVRDGNEPVTEGGNEVDGARRSSNKRKLPLQNEDSSEDETDFPADHKCPHASCGLDALMFVLHKIGSGFCPVKLMQKFGAFIRLKEKPTCTKILNTLRRRFLDNIYKCEKIKGVGHTEVLKIVEEQLKASSGQKVGLLSYSAESYKHCVGVYISKNDGRLKFSEKNFFANFNKIANYLELIVLRCDENGEERICKEWKEYCHSDICIQEVKNLSQPQDSETKPSSSNQVDHVLNERSVEFDQV